MAANRVSYFFDWHGPSMVIDTACSSTATALHQAILGLKTKDTTMALVCGSNLIISPDMFVHMSTLGFLSPSGNCKSFDSSADGYARGEGVTAILLKPFKEALSAEDPVRAVIKGSRVNQDGRTSGITSPSSEAQRRNIEQLYSIKKLDPGSIQYVEAHVSLHPYPTCLRKRAERCFRVLEHQPETLANYLHSTRSSGNPIRYRSSLLVLSRVTSGI